MRPPQQLRVSKLFCSLGLLVSLAKLWLPRSRSEVPDLLLASFRKEAAQGDHSAGALLLPRSAQIWHSVCRSPSNHKVASIHRCTDERHPARLASPFTSKSESMWTLLAPGFDQEAAAVLMARYAVFKCENEDSLYSFLLY